MSERRLANFGIEALEKLFDESRSSKDVLQSIGAELFYRKTSRAEKLLARVEQAISVCRETGGGGGNDEPWASYERRISDAERACIASSPVTLSSTVSGASLLETGIDLARRSEHTLVPHVRERLDRLGADFLVNDEVYGTCMRLAAFELRNGNVKSWPAFALLFRKMLGDRVIPWLPSLFLEAVGTAEMPRVELDLEEVLGFREFDQ